MEKIKDLPPAEQQEEVRKFLETHPTNFHTRTLFTHENYSHSRSAARPCWIFVMHKGRFARASASAQTVAPCSSSSTQRAPLRIVIPCPRVQAVIR